MLEQVYADAWTAVLYLIILLFLVVLCIKALGEKTMSAGAERVAALLIVVFTLAAIYNASNAIHYFIAPEYEAQQRIEAAGK